MEPNDIQLNLETIVVRVRMVRVRDIIPSQADLDRMVLVVAIQEDVRVLPVAMHVINKFLNAAVSEPFSEGDGGVVLEFALDGVVEDSMLYLGIHKLPEPFALPGHDNVGWEVIAADTVTRQPRWDGVAGQGSCLASACVRLDRLRRDQPPIATSIHLHSGVSGLPQTLKDLEEGSEARQIADDAAEKRWVEKERHAAEQRLGERRDLNKSKESRGGAGIHSRSPERPVESTQKAADNSHDDAPEPSNSHARVEAARSTYDDIFVHGQGEREGHSSCPKPSDFDALEPQTDEQTADSETVPQRRERALLPPSARRQPMAPSESYLPRTVRLRKPGRKKLVMPYISDFKAYAAHETAAVEQLQRVWRGHCGRQVVAIRVSEAEMESRLLLLEKDALNADLRHAFPSSVACHCTSLAMLFRAADAFPSCPACRCLRRTCTCAVDVSRCRSTWTAPSCADHSGLKHTISGNPPGSSYGREHLGAILIIQRIVRKVQAMKRSLREQRKASFWALGGGYKMRNRGVVDLDLSLSTISGARTMSSRCKAREPHALVGPLDFMGEVPCMRVQVVGAQSLITAKGIMTMTGQVKDAGAVRAHHKRLALAFPYALSLLAHGQADRKRLPGGEAHLERARADEIDLIFKQYRQKYPARPHLDAKQQGIKGVSGHVSSQEEVVGGDNIVQDAATGLLVWPRLQAVPKPAIIAGSSHAMAAKPAAPTHIYSIRRYNLLQWEQRLLLRKALAAHVRLANAGAQTRRALEPLRNVFLESGSDAPHAVAIFEVDAQGLTLEVLVARCGALPERVVVSILYEMLSLLRHVHAAGLLHNDVDVRSFSVSEVTGELKLRPLEFSASPCCVPGSWLDARSDERWVTGAASFFAPVRVQSPERLLGLRCSYTSDMWSVGVVARHLVEGAFPLPISDPPSILGFKTWVVENDLAPLPVFNGEPDVAEKDLRQGNAHHFTPALRRLLTEASEAARCAEHRKFSRELSHLVALFMDRRDHKRPSASEALNHRLFIRFLPSREEVKSFLKHLKK